MDLQGGEAVDLLDLAGHAQVHIGCWLGVGRFSHQARDVLNQHEHTMVLVLVRTAEEQRSHSIHECLHARNQTVLAGAGLHPNLAQHLDLEVFVRQTPGHQLIHTGHGRTKTRQRSIACHDGFGFSKQSLQLSHQCFGISALRTVDHLRQCSVQGFMQQQLSRQTRVLELGAQDVDLLLAPFGHKPTARRLGSHL